MAPLGLGDVAGVAQPCRRRKALLDHLLQRQAVWARGRAG